MRAIRRRLRACAWLALLSICTLAVGPTVSRLLLPVDIAHAPAHQAHEEAAMSHAMAPAHRHHQAIASAFTPPPETPNPPRHEHALEHCGLCVLAAHAFTFAHQRPELVAVSGFARPVLAALAPSLLRLRLDWSPASSRGPPLLA